MTKAYVVFEIESRAAVDELNRRDEIALGRRRVQRGLAVLVRIAYEVALADEFLCRVGFEDAI